MEHTDNGLRLTSIDARPMVLITSIRSTYDYTRSYRIFSGVVVVLLQYTYRLYNRLMDGLKKRSGAQAAQATVGCVMPKKTSESSRTDTGDGRTVLSTFVDRTAPAGPPKSRREDGDYSKILAAGYQCMEQFIPSSQSACRA